MFDLLDADRDGKLSRKELEAAPAVLAKLDIDEDEMITPAELMGEASGSDRYGPVVAPARPGSPLSLLHVVADEGEDAALAKALMERYGKGPFANGARFSDRPADVALTVHLGKRESKALMTLQPGKPLPAGVQVKTTSEGVTLQLGLTRLDLRASEPAGGRVAIDIRAQIKTLFQRLDADGKGYLERTQSRGAGFLAPYFDAMDRDGDGKVTEKEMLAWFDQMESCASSRIDRACRWRLPSRAEVCSTCSTRTATAG